MNEGTPRATIEELLAQSDWARGLAAALVGESDADDLVQDTWLSAIRRPPATGSSPRPWLARVMSNLSRNRWRGDVRRIAREASAARPEAQSGSDEVAQELEMHRALVDSLAEIDEPLRRTIVRRYFHGLSSAEIARSEGVPDSTVRTRLQRGLEALRAKLDRKYGDRSTWAALLLPLARRAAIGSGGVLASTALVKIAGVLVLGTFGWFVWKQARPRLLDSRADTVDVQSAVALSGAKDARISSAPSADPRTAVGSAAVSETAPPSETPTFLEARAIDSNGVPIRGARLVVVDRVNQDLEASEAPTATSTADGRLRLQVKRSDRYRRRGISAAAAKNQWTLQITIGAPGRTTHDETATLTDGTTTSLGDIPLRFGSDVHGRVVAPEGVALNKCWVDLITSDLSLEAQERGRFSGFGRARIARTRVAADGAYMFEGAPTGTFRVATLYYGAGLMQSCSEPFEVAPGGDVQVPELVLERNPNVIEGYLIAPDGEKIVRGSVTYRVSDAASPGSNPWVAAPRNEDGGFSIGFSSPTVCDVYAETLGEALVRNVPTGTHDLRLQVAQPTWIDLTVVDERDQPLSVYSVGLALVGDGFGLTGGEHPEGRTRVQVKALPFLVQVLAEGRVRRELGPFDPDHHPAQLKVILSPLAPLRGRVIFQGRPVAGAAVWLERVVSSDKLHTRNGFPCRFEFDIGLPESTTDSEGRFEMTWRDTVTYSLLVRATDLAEYETAPTEFSPETAHSNFEIELSNGGELRGRVIPASGDSAEGVLVGISRGDGIYRVIHTAADGRYAFDHLARGAWSIRRCEEDYAVSGGIEERDVFGFDPSLAAFTVEDGRTTTFDLDLSHASSRIEGELPSGLDRGRAWHVSLVPRGRRAADVLSHAIDSSGSFRVEASLLGPHDLVFADSGEGGRDQRFTATVDLERGATTWRFPLTTGVVEGDAAPNALLEHKWSGPAGATCTTHFLADARGHFRADTLPSGAGTIAVLSPGSGSVPRAVDVPADDVLHIDLR